MQNTSKPAPEERQAAGAAARKRVPRQSLAEWALPSGRPDPVDLLLGQLAATRVGWPREKVTRLVCAALTMNLGMLDLQQALQRQAKPLTPPQIERLHAHPAAACIALEKIGALG